MCAIVLQTIGVLLHWLYLVSATCSYSGDSVQFLDQMPRYAMGYDKIGNISLQVKTSTARILEFDVKISNSSTLGLPVGWFRLGCDYKGIEHPSLETIGCTGDSSIWNITLGLNMAVLKENFTLLLHTAEGINCSTSVQINYCNTSRFEPSASVVGGTPNCGYDCTAQFSCSASFIPNNFTATCQADARWSLPVAPCDTSCNNSFFHPYADAVGNVPVGGGQKKTFTCAQCPQVKTNFTRTCKPDGTWNDETNACSSDCNSGSGLSTGGIVGIVVAVLVVCGVVVA